MVTSNTCPYIHPKRRPENHYELRPILCYREVLSGLETITRTLIEDRYTH